MQRNRGAPYETQRKRVMKERQQFKTEKHGMKNRHNNTQ